MIVGLVAIVGIAALAVGLGQMGRFEQAKPTRQPDLTLAATTSVTSTSTPGRVEVPNVVGSTLAEAGVVLSAAGFKIDLVAGSSESTAAVVSSQKPSPGTVAEGGATVVLTTAMVSATPKVATTVGRVVVIDPGHQAHSDSTPEPIGPGSRSTKPAVSGGTTGVETDIPEFEVVLQISNNLKKKLEARGVKVVMTRTTNDVNLSNAQRASIANKARADLFLRVHADGSPDKARSGISTLYPASNRWTTSTWQRSRLAATAVQAGAVKRTGAVDLGTVARSDISGFNYATMPSVLVECGFMSNPVEDRLLASPHYQDKLAEGITEGVMLYLGGLGE